MVSNSALVTGILTSLAIFVACLILYAFLARKPSLNVIYYPARLLAGLSPPTNHERQSPLTWVFAALQTTESELVQFAGLDAAIYVRLLKTGVMITLLAMIYCILVIVPLCGTDNQLKTFNNLPENRGNKAKQVAYTTFDTLSMANINIKRGSGRLWGCLIGLYWVSGVVYYVLLESYALVTSVRARFQAQAVERPEQYVALVRDIPASKTEEEVDSFFRHVHPTAYEKCLLIRDLSKAQKAYTELEQAKAKLDHAEGAFLKSRTDKKTSPMGKRPEHKTGFLGLMGPKVDSIDFYTDKIRNELVPKLEAEQRAEEENKSTHGAAFVFFKTRRDAALAAQAVHAQDANTWVVEEAPEAREVVFENLHRPLHQRATLANAVVGIMVAMIMFYTIPLTFISGFTTLANLEKTLTFVEKIPKGIQTLLEAFLPRLAIMVFMAMLPTICIFLSKLEGLPSLSHVSRAAAGKFFAFNVFNVFLVVSIGGSLLGVASKIGKDPGSLVTVLGGSLAQSATNWVVFVALGMFAGWGTDLLCIGPLIMYILKIRFLCKTDKEERAAWEPQQIEYHKTVPTVLLTFTIILVYAVIAPMILPFGFVYFFLGYIVTVNQAMNVNVAKDFESQGRMWPHIHARILAALFLSQVTCFCYFFIKVAPKLGNAQWKSVSWWKSTGWQWVPFVIFMVLPCIATMVFHNYCKRKFFQSFEHFPLTIAVEEAKQVPTLSYLTESFTAPCLMPDESLDDAAFDDARSDALSSGLSSDTDEEGKARPRTRSYRKV